MAIDPQARRQLAQQGKLWLLALVCAAIGAFVVAETNRFSYGVLACLIALAVFGIPLLAYERSRRPPGSDG